MANDDRDRLREMPSVERSEFETDLRPLASRMIGLRVPSSDFCSALITRHCPWRSHGS